MRKIVINACHGGFGLSNKGLALYSKLSNQNLNRFDEILDKIRRDDPYLVQVVETLKEGASDGLANLKIVEIPDDVDWKIEEYDGMEWVSEVHRIWS